MKNKNKIINLLSDVIDLLMEEDKEKNLTVVEELPFAIDKEKFPNEMHELLDLLASEEWPEAAPGFLICEDNEEDKLDRAEGILDYISDDLSGKRFLDFGCGEGHVVVKASETAARSIGFDIVKTGIHDWEKSGKYLLTRNFDKVINSSPYDIILLYDVLDHCEDPIALLHAVRAVCKAETKIYTRCHSWMSRTGGHLYKKLNKAWAHLVFTEEELNKMNLKLESLRKYYFPMHTQKAWFNAANLLVNYSDTVNSIVEPFFQKPAISDRLREKFDGIFPEPQLQQSFNDYILKIKT